jgi:hypothetical protein
LSQADADSGASPRQDESEEERLDRNLGELLQELRVALPGVQVLFAFLLAVPFQQNFGKTTGFQKDVYLATLILTTISTALLISPTAYHRVTFRRQQKDPLIRVGNRVALAGLGSLGLAMSGAILLVTDFLFSNRTAALATAFGLGLFLVLWFVLPTLRRREG